MKENTVPDVTRIIVQMVHLFRGRVQQNPQQNKKMSETQVLPETTWADEEMPSGIPPVGSVVITISREFGSGGTHIGRLVAEKSQLNYVDQEIIDEVARRLGVPAQQAARQVGQTTGTVGHIVAKTFTRYCTSQDSVVNLRPLKSLSEPGGPTGREAQLR